MRGGKRENSGRKSKSEEIQLIERLSPMSDDAFKALQQGVKAGEFAFVKLFLEYYAGKPGERIDLTTNGKDINQYLIEIIDNTGKAEDSK